MKTHTTNFFNAFIQIADDCPTKSGVIPPEKTPKTIARAQYEMLIAAPYKHTSDDVIYATTGQPKGITREDFFSKPVACLRASALTRRYGWGAHFDAEGKVALYCAASAEYARLAADPGLKQVKAMRQEKEKA
ncbi:MAG: DUF6157 family protein [Treponema sp.]|nr:DUF6157 family protein [Treponema sp.]